MKDSCLRSSRNTDWCGESSDKLTKTGSIGTNTSNSKNCINVIYSNDMNNFINEIVGMKSTQETTASKTSLNSVNATLSKVRFGKLTFNRGPSQDEAEEKITILADASKPHNSRNMQSKFMTPKIKNSSNVKKSTCFNHTANSKQRSRQLNKELGVMERVFSQSSRNFPVQTLFKSSKGSKGSKSKSPSKEPVKKGNRFNDKKKLNQRSTTPVLQSRIPLHSSKPTKSKEHTKEPKLQAFNSNENNPASKFSIKPNKSDELESIEKEKVEFSTFSIEQDIANLAHIKAIENQGEHFVLEFDESEEQLAHFKLKSESPDGLKSSSVPKRQPTQAKAYIKPMPTIETKQGRAREKSLSPAPSDKELENKRMIMEYIKTVKEKISFMDK